MINYSNKSLLLLLFSFLIAGLFGLISITGCNRSNLFIPEHVHLEPAPIMVTADQIYKDYELDESAAEARYQGKQIWIIEARVDAYVESKSGNYLMIGWYYEEIIDKEDLLLETYSLASSTLQLESKYSDGFREIGDGYLVEVVGECQGISDGVVTVNIDWFAKTGTASPFIGALY